MARGMDAIFHLIRGGGGRSAHGVKNCLPVSEKPPKVISEYSSGAPPSVMMTSGGGLVVDVVVGVLGCYGYDRCSRG